MGLLSRDSLKKLFGAGTKPTAEDFASLIDSMVNKVNDNYSSDPEDGVKIAPAESNDRYISLFSSTDALATNEASWALREVDDNGQSALSLNQVDKPEKEDDPAKESTRLYLAPEGQLGVGTTTPQNDLDVNGITGMQGRVGTYVDPSIDFSTDPVIADGKWHNVLLNLSQFQIFEVIASVYEEGKSPRYSLLKLDLLYAYGNVQNTSMRVRSGILSGLDFQLVKNKDKTQNLQIRTRTKYDSTPSIQVNITKLWKAATPQTKKS